MTTPWLKVLRDLGHDRARTVLVVTAIAIGITGFSGVLSSYAVLTRELDRGYLATNPASATLRTDVVDEALIEAIESVPGVGAAEARRALGGRIKAGPAEWRNLTLFVVEEYGDVRVSRIEPQAGAWPPGAGEILIERDALQVARTRVGEEVRVRTARGAERILRVTGTVKDVGQAQARMENVVYGYITLETLALLGEEPYLDQVKILAAGDRLDERHVRRVAEGVRSLVEERGHPVRRLDVPVPGKHPHSDIMGLLLLVMAAFGLFVLALSGIIVANLMTALIAAQVRQVGMMKAVGGRRRQIAAIYLSQCLLLGAAALVAGVPAGMAGSRLLCRYMAVFLNFDVDSFASPPWVFLLVAAVGVAVPLLAAAVPVWSGTRVTVREALAETGASATAFGTTAFDRALSRISGLTRPLLLSIRNSFRRRTRLALTVVTLSAAGLCFITALNVRAALIRSIDRLYAAKRYDLTVSLGSMHAMEKIDRAVARTPGIRRAEGWIATEGSLPIEEEAEDRGRDGHAGGEPNGPAASRVSPGGEHGDGADPGRGRSPSPAGSPGGQAGEPGIPVAGSPSPRAGSHLSVPGTVGGQSGASSSSARGPGGPDEAEGGGGRGERGGNDKGRGNGPAARRSGGLHGGGPHGGGAAVGGRTFTVLALPEATQLLVPEIVEGRALRPGDAEVMIVNTMLASRLPQLKVGESVEIRMGPALVTLEVVGTARESFSPPTAYVPMALFEKRGHVGVTNSLRLALESDEPAAVRRVRAALDQALEEEGIRPAGSASRAETRYSLDQHMVMIYVFLIILAGVIVGVGGVGLITSLSLNVMERRRETGILLAIGATPSSVLRIVVAEGVVIGVLSWALAAALSWPVSRLLGDALVRAMFRSGLDFVFDPLGLAIWLAIAVVLSAAASLLPAWRASRLTVREVLAYE